MRYQAALITDILLETSFTKVALEHLQKVIAALPDNGGEYYRLHPLPSNTFLLETFNCLLLQQLTEVFVICATPASNYLRK
ncbi:hypothetical protein CWI77_04545 [Pseudidiomarina planktonica]|nr:hypothetical protein CWI77_04545 [Pseudidiomarina planktonica]